MQDRDYVYIRNRAVPHNKASRDWRCGVCESKLVTKHGENGWETVCANDPSHSPDSFITAASLDEKVTRETFLGEQLKQLEREGKVALKDRDSDGMPKRIRLGRIGRIRQGKKVDGRPVDLPYFIIDPLTDSESERAQVLEDVRHALENNAPPQDLEKPTVLPIRFLADLDEIIGSESYKKRVGKKGMVWCAGDGEIIQWKMDDNFRVEIAGGEPVKGGPPVSCPGGSDQNRHPWCEGCAPELELNFCISGYERTGVWMLRTKSMNFRDQFWTQLQMVRNLVANGIINGLAGTPFLLRRKVEQITVPGKDGQLLPAQKPITSIEIDPDWLQAMSRQSQRMYIQAPEPTFQIEAPSYKDDDYVADDDYVEVIIEAEPWYVRALKGFPERPWDAITACQYLEKCVALYTQEEPEDASQEADENTAKVVTEAFRKLFAKQGMEPADTEAAIDGLFHFLMGDVRTNATLGTLWYWGRRPRPEGQKGAVPIPEWEQEALSVLDLAMNAPEDDDDIDIG